MNERFDPKSKIKNIQGKDYLEVQWRIVWFRQDHPKGGIVTEVVSESLMKATVTDEEGHILATGHGSPKTQGVSKSRPFEGAETAAIGRALANAGYGTQFTGEDEGEHLADSPKEKAKKNGSGDLITADAWTKWQELYTHALALEIPVESVDRAKTTLTELRETYKELKVIVENAEAQAKAGA